MNKISTQCKENNNTELFKIYEEKYNVVIRPEIVDFILQNSGGYPVKNYVDFNGEEYEVRLFLSLDQDDEYYYIDKTLNYFLENTQGKIVPLGIDSGDNYYCVNNENGKVYYWENEEEKYYLLADSLEDFCKAFVSE